MFYSAFNTAARKGIRAYIKSKGFLRTSFSQVKDAGLSNKRIFALSSICGALCMMMAGGVSSSGLLVAASGLAFVCNVSLLLFDARFAKRNLQGLMVAGGLYVASGLLGGNAMNLAVGAAIGLASYFKLRDDNLNVKRAVSFVPVTIAVSGIEPAIAGEFADAAWRFASAAFYTSSAHFFAKMNSGAQAKVVPASREPEIK